MKIKILVAGLQWGDEGKGKIVDLLAADAEATVRFQGGHNAGHTIMVGSCSVRLHLLPSGVFHPKVMIILGRGMVISPIALSREFGMLKEKGIDLSGRLRISSAASLLLPTHQALDRAREKADKVNRIGTTGFGIGPAYEDRVARRGLQLRDLAYQGDSKERIRQLIEYHNFLLKEYYKESVLDSKLIIAELEEQRESLCSHLTDVEPEISEIAQNGKIIFEGAQGVMLDISFGTYPYVTSSNTIASSVTLGSGSSFREIDIVLGIFKAYTTRVGEGPFPSELPSDNYVADYLSKRGREVGTSTGRKRRCGWLDLVALRHAVGLSEVTHLAITKLDILSGLSEINLVVGYQINGELVKRPKFESINDLSVYQPCFKRFSGWGNDLSEIKNYDNLPVAAREYLSFIEDFVERPITIISVGPERNQTIVRSWFKKSIFKSFSIESGL